MFLLLAAERPPAGDTVDAVSHHGASMADAIVTESASFETNLERWLLSVRRESSVRDDVSDAGVGRATFLDVREPAAFTSRRLRWSANVPLREIDDGNAHALPPRTMPFVLITDPTNEDDLFAQARRFERDFKGVGWRLRAAFEGTDAFFDACKSASVERDGAGTSSSSSSSSGGLLEVVSGEVEAKDRLRLWEPSPELARWLPRAEAALRLRLDALEKGALRPTCVDLGSGAGRDAVWAASRGWNVVAIDNDARGLSRCAALAERHGVADRVKPLSLNLTKFSTAEVFQSIDALLETERWGNVRMVYAVRYLHKSLMRGLATALTSRCAVAWFHFMRGCEHTAVGRPTKDKDLLEAHELRDAFLGDGWNSLVDDVVHLPDGRPVSCFVAVRE